MLGQTSWMDLPSPHTLNICDIDLPSGPEEGMRKWQTYRYRPGKAGVTWAVLARMERHILQQS